MKHIKSFEQVNEGVIDAIKELIFPSVYRISFKVTHKRGDAPAKSGKPVKPTKDKSDSKDSFKPQHKFLDVKAKTEKEAEDKFDAALSKELVGLESKPEVEITSIHKVKKIEYKHLKLY